MKRFPKRTIKQVSRGNWAGFEGRKRVVLFDDEGFDNLTRQEQAKNWLSLQDAADDLIEDLIAAENAVAGLSVSMEDEDVVDAVRARAGYKDFDDRVHALGHDLSDAIDSL